jgi:hypothetical protein
VNSSETITYIHFENVYDVNKYYIDPSRVIEFVKLITTFFGINLIILDTHKYCIAPLEERMNHKIWHEEVDVKINNGDLITANFLGFIQKQLRGKKVDVFPEGASCFASLDREFNYENFDFNMNLKFIWKFRIKPSISKIKKFLYRSVKIRKVWILPDIDGRVVKVIPKSSNIEIISIDILMCNYKRVALFLADKFPGFDFRNSDAKYFHPVISELDEVSYRLLVKEIKHKIGLSKIIIKKHPSDSRKLDLLFSDLNAVIVSDEFRSLPSELILAQDNLIYCGYLSTILLFVDKKNLIYTIPKNRGVVEILEREYDSLKYVLNIGHDGFC